MRHAVVSLVVIAASGLAAPAAVDDRVPLDLIALLDEVERASPQLLAMNARAEAAANIAPQREALPDPKLSVAYTNDGLSGFTLGSSEFTNITVGWEQDVPIRKARERSADVARAQTESLRATSAAFRVKLRERVITLYTELWRLDRERALVAEGRALLSTASEAAQARYESGEGIQEGLIRAQAAVRRADLELEEITLMRRQTEISLGAALGRAEDPTFGPADDLPEFSETLDAEGLADAAIVSSPDVLETSARERTASAELEDARGQAKGSYSWVAAYQFRGGLDPMVMGGMSVRLPVWKDRKQGRAIEGATFERTAAEHDREDAEVRARAGARGRAADVASIDVRLRLYREAVVPQSAAAFESANAAFASGRAEMALVLDDLGRWIGDRREELALFAQRIEAIASLEAITGRELLVMPTQGRPQ